MHQSTVLQKVHRNSRLPLTSDPLVSYSSWVKRDILMKHARLDGETVAGRLLKLSGEV